MGEASGSSMAVLPELDIEGVSFPALATPPNSANSLFLAGAGVRGLEIAGRFVNFTAIGVYLDDSALHLLARKWAHKTAEELATDHEFFADIINGPFEKMTRVTMILQLTGEQYADKVAENCVTHWKARGIFSEAEAEALKQFREAFNPETFPPGSSIIFTHTASGALSIAFSKDDSVPEANKVVIENKALCSAILASIIGEKGVSPATKRSLAVRFCEHLKSHSVPTLNQAEVQMENSVPVNA